MIQNNTTLIKFGYPQTTIKEYRDWVLLLRPEQYTLGSLVLVYKKPTRKFSDISNESFNEYSLIIKEVEQHLSKLFGYDKINYLMLMMTDADVHLHIIPRYKKSITFLGKIFLDPDWPQKPSLINKNSLDSNFFNKVRLHIAKEFSLDRKKYRLGYATGVFDLFHVGHLRLIKRAKEKCDKLIIGVTTDDLMYSYKHKKAVIPFEERTEIVRSIRYVDEVVPQISMDKMSAWEKLKFNVMFVGDDWEGSEVWNRYEIEFEKVGVKIIYFPYTKGTSSSIINAELKKMIHNN